ncbi:hypothetical protein DPMN_052148 [Dreissena polymorpha]|uniref:Uncharacterized protein n=1 Tax=Dreissena polymorpha TaxID=45954 RepID=A0A9D4CL64_DREPO|nr:hypothetical protein DPMN_052148 [Dreissena polymorpha]
MMTREVKVILLVALVILDNLKVCIVEMTDVIVAMIMVVIVVVKMQLYLNNKKETKKYRCRPLEVRLL